MLFSQRDKSSHPKHAIASKRPHLCHRAPGNPDIRIAANRQLSKMVQDKLDRKYLLILKQFDELMCEADIAKLWDFYWRNGEFRGAFWAIIRHDRVEKDFKEQILRQVEITSLRNCCTILKSRKHKEPSVIREAHTIKGHDEREQQYLKEKCQYCRQIRELETELFLKQYQVDKLERHLALYSSCRDMHR